MNNSMTPVIAMTLQSPETIGSLATSGILAHVQVCIWSATKQDQDISDEVTSSKNADRNSAKVVKYLMANCPEHHMLIKNRAAWHNWVKRHGFPWAGSWVYIPNTRIPKFMREFEERNAETEKLVDKLIDVYPSIIANTAFQGDMFKREDYPTPEEVRRKFAVTLFTQEVPTGDFRNQVTLESVEQVKQHFNKQLPSLVQGMLDKQIATMSKLMNSISNCCKVEVGPDGKVSRGRIFDSTIQQALELCDTYKSFNVTNDPRIENARSALEHVLQDINVDVLRESDAMRATVKAGVDDIMSKFGMKI